MKRLALGLGALAAGLAFSLFSGQAQAAPTCTGITATVPTTGTVTAAFLLTPGNCVNAGDKTFGNFADTGLSNNGDAVFTFAATPGSVTVGFQGSLSGPTTGTLDYQVAVNPALAGNFLIVGYEHDYTLNAADGTGFASGTLGSDVTPAGGSLTTITCTRDVNGGTSDCPQTTLFSRVSSLSVAQTLTLGSNAVATQITDTIIQAAAPAPEPASLGLLGTGLLGLGLLARRRRR